MPKKRKLIICPRCRRTVSAEEYREHFLGHRGKKLFHLTSPTIEETEEKAVHSNLKNETPDSGDASKSFTSMEPGLSILSESQIREKFESALQDVGASYASLTVDVNEPEFIKVFIDENRNLILKYSPLLLKTVSEEGVSALLLHEACHVKTLPNSLVRIPEIGGAQGKSFVKDNLSSYDEFLAHVEFVSRFSQDPRYGAMKDQKRSLFPNFEIIIESTRVSVSNLQEKRLLTKDTEWKVREKINSIVRDALFFYEAKDPSFIEWCEKQSLQGLAEFGKWIHEDFEHIHHLGLSLEESHKKVIVSGTLGMSVNPYRLLYGKISFANTAKKLHEELVQKGRDVELVQLWEKRRVSVL